VVGGWAVAAHGHPRGTKDFDLFVNPTTENSHRVFAALVRFGAPMHDLQPADLATPNLVFQVGVAAGARIGITSDIDGVSYEQALIDALQVQFEGVVVPVIGRRALIRNKRATGRAQDAVDTDVLSESISRGSGSGRG
jgi:hypothetical protein